MEGPGRGKGRRKAEWRELLGPSGSHPTKVKVKALLDSARAGDPSVLEAAREGITTESNPYVKATLASVIGTMGDRSDRANLMGLLESADGRVVANALQALRALKIEVDLPVVSRLVQSASPRVRATALALLGETDPEQVFLMVTEVLARAQADLRASLAHLLGEMSCHPRSRELLLSMLVQEKNKSVMRQIAASLKNCASRKSAPLLVGPLYALGKRSRGTKNMLVRTLLRDIATEVGWVAAHVDAVGESYVEKGALADAGQPPPTIEAEVEPREPECAPQARAGMVPPARKTPDGPPSSGEEIEGDAPLSFTAAWGEAPAARPACQSRSMPAPAPGTSLRPGGRGLAIAAAFLGGGLALWWFWPRGPITVAAGTPPPVPTVRPVLTGSASPIGTIPIRGSSFSGSYQVVTPEPVQVGTSLDLRGRVVSSSTGRVVLASAGRYYLLEGHDNLDRVRIGDSLSVRGEIRKVQGSLVSVLVARP